MCVQCNLFLAENTMWWMNVWCAIAGIQGMAPSNKQQGFGAGCLTDTVSCNLYTTHSFAVVRCLDCCYIREMVHWLCMGCLVTNKTKSIEVCWTMGGLDPIRLARRFSASIPREKKARVTPCVCVRALSLVRCQSNSVFPCHWPTQMHASSSPTVLCNNACIRVRLQNCPVQYCRKPTRAKHTCLHR
jgi:hypothetical protein